MVIPMKFLLIFAISIQQCKSVPSMSYEQIEPIEVSCTASPCLLEKSTQSQLLRLVRSNMDGSSALVVARSYDQNDWEGVPPSPLRFTCDGNGCEFQYDMTHIYAISVINVLLPADQKFAHARFLTQATFGPTLNTINNFPGADSWIDDQMAMQPTLLREYMRARQNPRMGEGMLGTIVQPCDIGSRWHQYAFNYQDKGKQLLVEASGSDNYMLSVTGSVLTEVNCTECESFLPGLGVHTICQVYEAVGANIQIGNSRCARSSLVNVPNPSIWFATNPPSLNEDSVLYEFDDTATFINLTGVADTVLLQQLSGECPSTIFVPEILMQQGDLFYRFDPRMKLFTNTLGQPALQNVDDVNQYCPAVTKNIMNTDSCLLNSPCGASGLTCGSRGEIANDPMLGNRYTLRVPTSQQSIHAQMGELDGNYQIHNGKQIPHLNVATKSSDQLRQRIAWALFQMIPISEDLGRTSEMESWQAYFDIFIANAFGNYRDVLKEIVYSPMMGYYLSYYDNKAYSASASVPDQNFAREVMQLFTIGLWKLHPDGTPVLDANGKYIPTYDNLDVVTFSRVWTGFTGNSMRGNTETVSRNILDPMKIRYDWRDSLPKTKLDGYLGDGYPLCSDLPAQHFLRKGAKYSLNIGPTSVEGAEYDDYAAAKYEDFTPDGVILKLGSVVCNGYTYCGGPTKRHRARWRVTLLESTTLFRSGVRKPVLYINGDNGNSFRIYGVAHFAWRKKYFFFYPTQDNDPNVDYAQLLTKFREDFPRGTLLTVTNSPTSQAPDSLGRFALQPDSGLFQALCAKDLETDECTFPLDVTLESDLLDCEGSMCNADDVTVVKIQDQYYSYVKPTCVKLTFFNGQTTIMKTHYHGNEYTQCADPSMSVAAPVCCTSEGTVQSSYRPAGCLFLGERVMYDTAVARCTALGGYMCPADLRNPQILDYGTTCSSWQYAWTKTPCSIQVQVDIEGLVNLVDPLSSDGRFQNSSENSFAVRWKDDVFPTFSDPKGCVVGPTRLTCDISLEEVKVFNTLPTRSDVEASLFIGAFDPQSYGIYTCVVASCTDDVVAYVQNEMVLHQMEDEMEFNNPTVIFGLKKTSALGGGYSYFFNKKYVVKVGTNGESEFRNPPHFMPLLGEVVHWKNQAISEPAKTRATRAAEAETNALIDHLFYHENTAPFVAYRLIQRLVTSNPSPRYVQVVSDAFKSGNYVSKEGNKKGSGKYGCLKATVSAILLDREARSSILDADPSYGVAREPFLKVLHVMRAMEYNTFNGQEMMFYGLFNKIGMDTFRAPSVFGFYLPEYEPHGIIGDLGLVSPETQLTTAPLLFGLLNGLTAMIDDGIAHCNDGFGFSRIMPSSTSRSCSPVTSDGSLTINGKIKNHIPDLVALLTLAQGFPDLAVSSAIVDHLDLLLTGGRLSAKSKASVLNGMPIYTMPEDGSLPDDMDACAVGFHVEEHCNCDTSSTCTVGDLCRKDDGSRHWAPPRGCIRWRGPPYAVNKSTPNTPNPCCSTADPTAALEHAIKTAQKLMIMTPEFHNSNLNMVEDSNRPIPPEPTTDLTLQGYRAIVVVMMPGGADSFNFLVPPGGNFCDKPLDYEHYQKVRGVAATKQPDTGGDSPKTIDVPGVNGTSQVCTRFGVHNDLKNVRQMYIDGDAAFFTNIGALVEPMNKDTLRNKKRPPQLFSHNMMQRSMQNVHAQEASSKGVLGRIVDAIDGRKNMYSLDSMKKIVEAAKADVRVLDQRHGLGTLNSYGHDFKIAIDSMITNTSKSIFAETYTSILQKSLKTVHDLGDKLTEQAANNPIQTTFADTNIGRQLKKVAQVIKLRTELDSQRDVFVVKTSNFDTHATLDYFGRLAALDVALGNFKEEMVSQGIWKDVVVTTISDFGRTLTSNGQGTDHAWGGNYFTLGGSIKDNTFLGEYPSRLDGKDSQSYGRGIMIPKLGYEAMWGPIIDWFGVHPNKWDTVLPNLANFPHADRYDKTHLFEGFGPAPKGSGVVGDKTSLTFTSIGGQGNTQFTEVVAGLISVIVCLVIVVAVLSYKLWGGRRKPRISAVLPMGRISQVKNGETHMV